MKRRIFIGMITIMTTIYSLSGVAFAAAPEGTTAEAAIELETAVSDENDTDTANQTNAYEEITADENWHIAPNADDAEEFDRSDEIEDQSIDADTAEIGDGDNTKADVSENATADNSITEEVSENDVLSEPAAETDSHYEMNEQSEASTEEEFIYVNPLYEEIISEDDLITLPEIKKRSSKRKTAASVSLIDTLERAGDILCEQMIARSDYVVLKVDKSAEDFLGLENRDIYNQIIQQALIEREDCHSGDYLRFHYSGFRIGTTTSESSVELRFSITYFTTAEQEHEVDTVLAQVMETQDLQSDDDAKTILNIYNYITENVTYDQGTQSDQDYKIKYSAYAALIEKKAVCQGYASLFYRMCRECGVSSRTITGIGTINGISDIHAWNIARIGEYYYNVDATWDAGREEDDYQYFLKCDDNFEGHLRDSDPKMDYTSEKFYAGYPMSNKDYEFLAEIVKITLQPEDVHAYAGEQVILHVEAAGGEISYRWQWKKDGSPWKSCTSAGSDTDTFSFKMKESLSGRIYRCIVTGKDMAVESEEAHIILNARPLEITTHPESIVAAVGEPVVLHVEAVGSGISYQWQWTKDGKTWKNCTSAGYNTDTFRFTMKSTLAGRQYRCLVSGTNDSIKSNNAQIILKETMQIVAQPEDVIASVGEQVVLHLETIGNGLSYQWQWSLDGNNWRNCSSEGYNTDTFQFAMKERLAGRIYRCIVNSSTGTKITSELAHIYLKNTVSELPEDLRDYEQLTSKYNNSGVQTASFKYGSSVLGRDLIAWSIAPSSYNRTILLNFEIHGWEDSYAGDGQLLVDLGNSIVSHYSAVPDLNSCRLIIIPSCNPDGLADGHTNNGFGRCNAEGVDLNRDFDIDYQPYSSERNYTPYAFSGKESAALRDLVYAVDPYVAIDFHGWENCTIGSGDIGEVFARYCGLNHKNEFSSSAHGYFAYWAQSQGAKGLLVEFKNPESLNHDNVIEALDHLISEDFGTETTEHDDMLFSRYCPITTYTISADRVYVQREVGETGTDYGYIDGADDQCKIIQVYEDRWCKVRYPVSGYTKTGYCQFSQFYAEDCAVTPYKGSVTSTTTVFTTSEMTVKLGSVWTTDEFTVVGEKENVCQIIYPLDSGGYKMGWIDKKQVNTN